MKKKICLVTIASISLCAGCTSNAIYRSKPYDQHRLTEHTKKEKSIVQIRDEDDWVPTLLISNHEKSEKSKLYSSSDNKSEKLIHDQVDDQIYYPKPLAGIEVSEKDLNILMSDKNAFFVFTKNPNYEVGHKVAFPVHKGSIKDNFKRLAEKMKIKHFVWDLDYNFYIDKDKIITADQITDILSLLCESFPIEAKVDGKEGDRTLKVMSIGTLELPYSFTVLKGSFKKAFERLSDRAGWDHKWGFDYDFNVPDTYVIRGTSYEDILDKLIDVYKLPINKTTDE